MTILFVILLPLLVGTGAALLAARWGVRACAIAAGLVNAASLSLVLWEAPRVFAGERLMFSVPWLPDCRPRPVSSVS